jgi:release factor glutamine methyltransferase
VNRRQVLTLSRSLLADARIEDASLEAEILLRHVLGIGRARLFAELALDFTPLQEKDLRALIERRLQGEPSAYITGRREFYGLDFNVNPRVLIPRPETEMLVEKTIEICRARSIQTIADIGTGCGAIAVSLAVNVPSVSIYATDISPEALEVAAQNAAGHGAGDRITFLRGNLLEPLPQPVDIIVANLPYVNKADLSLGGFEPLLALDGGLDGLDKIRELGSGAGTKLNSGGHLILEIGQGQADAVFTMLRQALPSGQIEISRDLAGIARLINLRLT